MAEAAPAELSGDKAARIVEAMRVSVSLRGIAGSTFDHVAREAGVSRGLLHYYFGTKEQLLIEVVRRECDVRIERLEAAVAGAQTAEALLGALVQSFQEYLGKGPIASIMFYEVLTAGQRNDDIAAELSELGRRLRTHLAEVLRTGSETGVLRISTDADALATFLFALADGLTIRRLAEPDLDLGPVMEQAITAARAVLR